MYKIAISSEVQVKLDIIQIASTGTPVGGKEDLQTPMASHSIQKPVEGWSPSAAALL
jgi:hypothetical protein